MASERQILANRRNAQKSTGPKTALGKKRSSKNAYNHGLSLPIPRGFNEAHRAVWRRLPQRLREQQPTRLLVSGRRMAAPRCIRERQL